MTGRWRSSCWLIGGFQVKRRLYRPGGGTRVLRHRVRRAGKEARRSRGAEASRDPTTSRGARGWSVARPIEIDWCRSASPRNTRMVALSRLPRFGSSERRALPDRPGLSHQDNTNGKNVMTADIVNLRQLRRRKARADKENQAAANRAKHGRTKAARRHEEARKLLEEKRLDGSLRERQKPSDE